MSCPGTYEPRYVYRCSWDFVLITFLVIVAESLVKSNLREERLTVGQGLKVQVWQTGVVAGVIGGCGGRSMILLACSG